MARETALAFFRKVHEDRTLRQRLDRVRPRDISGLPRFAADAGYLSPRAIIGRLWN